MSNFKYKSGTMVSYDMGVIKGQAIVMGATEGSPLMGNSYILKDPKVNSDVYPYDFFVCHELYIKDDIRIGGKDTGFQFIDTTTTIRKI